MNDSTVLVGAAALVAVGGLAWYAASRKLESERLPAPGKPPANPLPAPVNTSTPIQQAPFQDTAGQALALELARQRADAERRDAEAKEAAKQTAIFQIKSTIAAVENAQVISLTDIMATENDQSGLSGMIDLVRKEGYASCDAKGWDIFGACHGMVDRDSADPKVNWSGHARWKGEVQRRLKPKQANLARLEEQFIGLKYDLKNKFGVDYVPSPVAVAAHNYAAANPGR